MVACRAGSLEPSLGVLHADKDGRASFAFDLVEPLRPVVDRAVLGLVTSRTFRLGHDFIALRDGVCRVGIELAAEVAKTVGEQLRPRAEKIVTEMRTLVQAATAPIAELRAIPPKLQQQTRKQEEAADLYDREEHEKVVEGGTCSKCGVWVGKRRQFCDPCRTERRQEARAEQSRKMWERWRAEGIDPSHSPEARQKMSEWVSQSNRLKPRKGYKRKKKDVSA